MRAFSREAWSYAILLIVLFGIAGIAVWQAILFLEPRIEPGAFPAAAAILWTITLGFMLIAGAFGLWAIQFAAEAESRRRISLLVHAMAYLRDGLLAVDARGRISGANPAALTMGGPACAEGALLNEAFPCLTTADLRGLLDAEEPYEIERSAGTQPPATLRFRSQPSEGVVLILVSDVTRLSAQQLHLRQAARLQLIGQIARGVAHDFNDLFCAIAGHAALLARSRAGSPEWPDSIGAITRAVDRGCGLAEHLVALSQSERGLVTPVGVDEALRSAAASLHESLPRGCQVQEEVREIPSVALSRLQLEQVVFHLGLLVCDAAGAPCTVRIRAGRPHPDGPFDVSDKFAGVVLVEAGERQPSAPVAAAPAAAEPTDEGGLMLLVVRSIVEEAGGVIDCLGGSGTCAFYRVALPPEPAAAARAQDMGDLPPGLRAYIATWHALVIAPPRQLLGWSHALTQAEVQVERAENIVTALARIEQMPRLDALIVDLTLLGENAAALLKAFVKLRPTAAILVAGAASALPAEPGLIADIALLPPDEPARGLFFALMDAKSRSAKRRA